MTCLAGYGGLGWSPSVLDPGGGRTAAEEPAAFTVLLDNPSRQPFGELPRIHARTWSARAPLWNASEELHPEVAPSSGVKFPYQLATPDPKLSDGTIENALRSIRASKMMGRVSGPHVPVKMSKEASCSG